MQRNGNSNKDDGGGGDGGRWEGQAAEARTRRSNKMGMMAASPGGNGGNDGDWLRAKTQKLPRSVDAVLSGLYMCLWITAALNIIELILFLPLFTFQILLCMQLSLETLMFVALFFVALDTVEWRSGHQRAQLSKLAAAFFGCFIEIVLIIWIIIQTFVIKGRYTGWPQTSQIVFCTRQLVWTPAFWCLFHHSLTKIAKESKFLHRET